MFDLFIPLYGCLRLCSFHFESLFFLFFRTGSFLFSSSWFFPLSSPFSEWTQWFCKFQIQSKIKVLQSKIHIWFYFYNMYSSLRMPIYPSVSKMFTFLGICISVLLCRDWPLLLIRSVASCCLVWECLTAALGSWNQGQLDQGWDVGSGWHLEDRKCGKNRWGWLCSGPWGKVVVPH